jgi:type IV secretion system protein VirB10
VDRHFWQRFGAAILISLVDAAAQAAQRSATVIYDTSTSQNVATEALKGSIGLVPTITKNQGDRIQVLVARDLDFREVYQLRDSVTAHQQ